MTEDEIIRKWKEAQKHCVKCGRTKSAHHKFKAPPRIPKGCVCGPGAWGEIVTPMCDQFIASEDDGSDEYDPEFCGRCEHYAECHGSVR